MTLPGSSIRSGGRALTLAVLVSAGFACEPEIGSSISHPAAALPEACHSVIHWSERPDAAALALLRSLQDKQLDQVGMPEVFFEGPGVLAIYTDPKEGWSSRLAFVDLPESARPDLHTLRTRLDPGFVLEAEGRRLWLLPKSLAGFSASSAARLERQPWFAGSLEGLHAEAGVGDGASLDLHFDLSRLLDLARERAGKAERQQLDLLVGIDSFLSLGMRIHPDMDPGQGKLDLYFRLSRTPDGIAAALDVEQGNDLLSRLIPQLPAEAGYLVMNFRIATLADALKAKIFGADGTRAVGLASQLSQGFSFLLRGDLPRAFGNQWALVDPKGNLSRGSDFNSSGAYLLSTLDYSKKLGDAMLPLAQMGKLFGKEVEWKRIDGGLIFEAVIADQKLVLVLGKQFGAIAAQSSKQTLLDLLAREAKSEGSPIPMPEGLPALSATARLRGRGAWSLEFLRAFLPGDPSKRDPIRDFLDGLISKDRRFRFQSLRVDKGFLLQGRW